MIAEGLATLALATAASEDPGYRFAVDLARTGRPAASRAEARAHDRVERRFRLAGLRTERDRFAVPGRGRSRNVVGIYDSPRRCLDVLMAHIDTVPPSPGADDNASGVGVLVALGPRLVQIRPGCDVWLIATGAEERIYTGHPDHLGALAVMRRLRRIGRVGDVRVALSLDEVGRGNAMWLRSPEPRVRDFPERAVLRAGRQTALEVRWVSEPGTGLSDHRELELAGIPAAKLGVPSEPLRHGAGDVPSRLHPRTFVRVRRLVEHLLAG
jgi:aminopeptidase YwaD